MAAEGPGCVIKDGHVPPGFLSRANVLVAILVAAPDAGAGHELDQVLAAKAQHLIVHSSSTH